MPTSMNNERHIIRRGCLFFEQVKNGNVKCTYGHPDSPESEYVFELHKSYFASVIAGLRAMGAKK